MATERIVVGISGASGAPLAVSLLRTLKEHSLEVHLIVTPGAWRTIQEETSLSPEQICSLADIVHDIRDVGAPPPAEVGKPKAWSLSRAV